MLNIIIYICAYLSGMFFGVMVFTIIENASKEFRQFVRKVCQKIPFIGILQTKQNGLLFSIPKVSKNLPVYWA